MSDEDSTRPQDAPDYVSARVELMMYARGTQGMDVLRAQRAG